MRVLDLTIIFLIIFFIGFSFQESYSQYMGPVEPSEWDITSDFLVNEFVDNILLQDNSVVEDSIVNKTMHTLEDELPPGMYIKILYGFKEGQEVKHNVMGFKVVFPELRTPDNAYLEKLFETEYLPPRKVIKTADQFEHPYLQNLAKLVLCKQGFERILKSSDLSFACVKPDSVPKLVERGWAHS